MNTTQMQAAARGNGIQLAIGAASLFLFIVGLKRTFRVEDAQGNLAGLEDKGTEDARPAQSE
jgi:hypothetical protein